MLLAAFAFPSPASAHNYLASSTPEAGATLTALPAEFAVTTNDDLLDTGNGLRAFAMQVVGADGLYYGDGCVEVDGATMTSVPALGPAGQYTLAWQVVSIDGHPVDGTIDFAWDPAAAEDVAAGSESAPVCGEDPADADPTPAASANPTPSQSQSGSVEETTEATEPSEADAGQSTPTAGIVGGLVGAAALVGGIVYTVWRRRKP